MKRYGQVIGVRSDQLDEYIRAHAEVWPDVLAMISQCNIRNYSIFHRANQLFAYFEYIGDGFEADMAKMAGDPITQDWWEYVMPMQEPVNDREKGEWWASMELVFHAE